MAETGTLYIISTPLGNLKDITIRTIEVLKTVDYIACEDTRRSLKLLNTFDIHKELIVYNEHTIKKNTPVLLDLLENNHTIALISDAGMPLIADSGLELVQACYEKNYAVQVIPGPSAVITALVYAGFTTQNFLFVNFLPRKKSKLLETIQQASTLRVPVVCFESPHRLLHTLEWLQTLEMPMRICICREMTKINEEILRGSLDFVYNQYLNREVIGEITIVLDFLQ
ncbi:16S rRNA (cytidine(1402)-2'-O)-methyltransferase [bacterium]|nr:16S rRNA (cytidine(1402)-2'-O)-methyltransferase [bacterium]